MRIQLGAQPDGGPLSFDLDALLTTRLLIQANSGAGKSWLLRRLMEQLFGHVQVIAIDPEGEFATLREKFDFALVGAGGEIPADVRIAGETAEKLLELRVSAVCDLYEMKSADRHAWVARFLSALVDAPKKLWHPVIVVVDEAQMFCPEAKAGESIASGPMIDLCTRGRKRGYCPIWATQRLANVNKQATAMLLNRLVGGTFEDVDIKRALDLLSVAPEDKREFSQSLKTLDPGFFYAFGRAIAKERVLFKVGPVQTSHPKPGSSKHAAAPPPAPEKIRAVLAKLAEIPHQAEEKARTTADLRRRVDELTRELATAQRAAKNAQSAAPDPDALKKAREAGAAEVRRALEAGLRRWKHDIDKRFATIRAASASEGLPSFPFDEHTSSTTEALPSGRAPARTGAPATHPAGRPSAPPPRPRPTGAAVEVVDGKLAPLERKILTALAQYPAGLQKERLAVLVGAHLNGTFYNNLGALRTRGFASDKTVAPIQITDEGLGVLGPFDPLPTGEDLRRYWYARLSRSESRMLEVLCGEYPEPVEKEALAAHCQMQLNGTFYNVLGALRTRGLVTPAKTPIRAAAELFED